MKDQVSTPKAFAKLSPGFERSENPGIKMINEAINPEGVRRVRE
jgi:hypothetical protein